MINEEVNPQYGNINIIVALKKYKWPFISLLNAEFLKNGFIPSQANNEQLKISKNRNRFVDLEYIKGKNYRLSFDVNNVNSVVESGSYKFFLSINNGQDKTMEVPNVLGMTLSIFVSKIVEIVSLGKAKSQQDFSHLGFAKQDGTIIDRMFKYLKISKESYGSDLSIKIELLDPNDITYNDTKLGRLLWPLSRTSSLTDKLYDKIFDIKENSAFYKSTEQREEVFRAVNFIMNKDILNKYFTKQNMQFNGIDIGFYSSTITIDFEKADKRKVSDEMIKEFHQRKKIQIFKQLNRFTPPKKSWEGALDLTRRNIFKLVFNSNYKSLTSDDVEEFEEAYNEYFSQFE